MAAAQRTIKAGNRSRLSQTQFSTNMDQDSQIMPLATVALPVYNSKDIAWLALESLCHQKTKIPWELIVAEDQHEYMLGIDWFDQYMDKLAAAGCTNISYIYYESWVPLPIKWRDMGISAHPCSQVFLLQAADCYSQPHRIQQSYDKIMEGYDWIDYQNGLFYHIDKNKVIQYSAQSRTNLDMAFKTKYARRIPMSNLRKSIDGFLFNNMRQINPKAKTYIFPQLSLEGINTDGLNNISMRRSQYYENIRHPFIQCKYKLNDTALPSHVIDRLTELN